MTELLEWFKEPIEFTGFWMAMIVLTMVNVTILTFKINGRKQ